MANVSGASLTPIYDRLNGASEYHPFEADTFCDWAMEAGDIVTVKRGEEEYQSPVHSTRMVWRGTPNIEVNSTGSKERDAVSRVSRQKYARSGGGMRQMQGLYYEFYSEDGYLHSYVEMSESRLVTHFDNELSDVHSQITQTAEQIRTDVYAAESTLYSYVDQTATYINSVVANTASDLGSAILQTANQIRSEVHAANSSLYSYVDQTATYINQVVANTASGLSSRIQQEANRIGLVVEGTGANAKIKAAQIVAGINENGYSGALISADRITLDGTTKLSGSLSISQGHLNIIGGAYIGGDLYVTGGNSLTLQGSGTPATQYSITPGILGTMIKTVSKSGNVLTLTRFDGTSETFSKATSLDGEWSGTGTITVVAKQNNVEVDRFTRTLSHSLDTTGSSPVMKITSMTGGTPPTYEDTGHNISLSTYLETKTITSNGTYTPSSGIGFSSVTVSVQSGTTLSGEWSSGHLEVTASPQGTKLHRYIYSGDIEDTSSDGNSWYVPILSKNDPNASSSERTGHRVLVNATGRYNAGWAAAVAQNSIPTSSNTGNSRTFYWPSSTVGSSQNRTYTLASDGDNAVKLYTTVNGSNVTIARIAHNKYSSGYSSGWTTAAGKVVTPTSSNTGSTLTITYPNKTTPDGSNGSIQYSVSVDNSYAYIKAPGGTTVARVSNSGYTNGLNKGNGNVWFMYTNDSRYDGNPNYNPQGTFTGGTRVALFHWQNPDAKTGVVPIATWAVPSGGGGGSAWLTAADSEVNHQGYLQYDQLYGVTLNGNVVATWRTQAKGSSYSHNASLTQIMEDDVTGSGSSSVYYGKLYNSSGQAISGSNRYWYMSNTNIGSRTVYWA